MGSILGGGGGPEPPKAKPAPPPPTTETAEQAATQTKKRGPTAREATFLTGDLIPQTDKKKKLG